MEQLLLDQCLNNSVVGNTITNCKGAIGVNYASDNRIIDNEIISCEVGISVILNSESNTIYGNTIKNGETAIRLALSSNNNNIFENIMQSQHRRHHNKRLFRQQLYQQIE